MLELPVDQVPGYNPGAYNELVAAMERLKSLELPHIGMIERDQDYPIGLIMEGLTLVITLKLFIFLDALLLVLCIVFGHNCAYLYLIMEKCLYKQM